VSPHTEAKASLFFHHNYYVHAIYYSFKIMKKSYVFSCHSYIVACWIYTYSKRYYYLFLQRYLCYLNIVFLFFLNSRRNITLMLSTCIKFLVEDSREIVTADSSTKHIYYFAFVWSGHNIIIIQYFPNLYLIDLIKIKNNKIILSFVL